MMGGVVYSGLLTLCVGLLRPLVVPSIVSSVNDAPRPLAQCAVSGSVTTIAVGTVQGWGLVPTAVGVLDGTCSLVFFLSLLETLICFFWGSQFAKLPTELWELPRLCFFLL